MHAIETLRIGFAKTLIEAVHEFIGYQAKYHHIGTKPSVSSQVGIQW
jgi:hypothetical protein